MVDLVETPVKSAWASKINWTQIISVAGSMSAAFGLDLPKDQIVAVILGIQAAQGVATWAFKTFFTTTVTPSSAAKI